MLDRDLMFLFGLAFLPLAFVALVSAWADRRAPWAALILVLIGLGLAGWAWVTHPEGGYVWADLPQVMMETIARYWRR